MWERDNHRCILCGSYNAAPVAHYISRAQGGLGIEQNIVTLCDKCHRDYDQTALRRLYRTQIRQYLFRQYTDWDESKLFYKKG